MKLNSKTNDEKNINIITQRKIWCWFNISKLMSHKTAKNIYTLFPKLRAKPYGAIPSQLNYLVVYVDCSKMFKRLSDLICHFPFLCWLDSWYDNPPAL